MNTCQCGSCEGNNRDFPAMILLSHQRACQSPQGPAWLETSDYIFRPLDKGPVLFVLVHPTDNLNVIVFIVIFVVAIVCDRGMLFSFQFYCVVQIRPTTRTRSELPTQGGNFVQTAILLSSVRELSCAIMAAGSIPTSVPGGDAT